MSDAISNYGRMAQSNAAMRSNIEKVDKKSASAAQGKQEAAPQAPERQQLEQTK